MKKKLFLFLGVFFILTTCQNKAIATIKVAINIQSQAITILTQKTETSPASLHEKSEIPILCYHRIRKILATDGNNMKTYSVTPEAFASQMKALSDNGYL